jgi:hypothetical protein
MFLSQIDLYLLYEPLPPDVVAEIYEFIGKPPEAHMKHVLTQLEAREFVYRPAATTSSDPMLTHKDHKWRFFRPELMASLITAAKSLAFSGIAELPDDFVDSVIQSLNPADKLVEHERFTFGATVLPLQDKQWARLLAQRMIKDLFTPKIAKLIDITVPFKEASKLAQSIASFTPEETQRVVGCLKTVIDECNDELGKFGARLTKPTILAFHAVMAQLLISSNLEIHTSKLTKLVADFADMREDYEADFMAQTALEQSVQLLAREFEDQISAECYAAAKKFYTEALCAFALENTRDKLQRILEVSDDIAEQVKYVQEPVATFRALLEQNWEVHKNATMNDMHTLYEEGALSLLKLADWVCAVGSSLKQHSSSKFFETPTSTSAAQSNEQIATAHLLKDILQGLAPATDYIIESIAFKLLPHPHTIMPARNPPNLKLALADLDPLKLLICHLKRVSNYAKFTEQLENAIRGIAERLWKSVPMISELDPGFRLLAQYKRNALGCIETCPCCNRCCDEKHSNIVGVNIGEADNAHKCIGGHQYRGMMGYSLLHSKYASLRTCNDIKDTDKLAISGQISTWSEFKSSHPNWDFGIQLHETTEQKQSNHARMVALWQRVGEAICKEYLNWDQF